MKQYFIFRYRWAPKHASQWSYYSFLARLDKTENMLLVPYIEIKEDGSVSDPFHLRRLIAITELTQIGSQSIPDLSRTLNGEAIKLSVYTMDIYQARAEPLLEGSALEVIFEDEIVNQGNVFGTPVQPIWNQVLQLELEGGEKVRGHDRHPAPLIRYHGTSKEAYASILRTGLRPTTRQGMMGNNMYYLGHYAKALRYSYQDSQRAGGIRSDPVLLRYAIFVRPEEVLRVLDAVPGASTQLLQGDALESIPEKNRWLFDCDDWYKDFALSLLRSDRELDTTKSSMFHSIQQEKPFETLEEARRALLIGDQEERPDPSTYFTGSEPKTILGHVVSPPASSGSWKAYEVEPFWVPVKHDRFPNGIRYYSFTKYPEIAVTADKGNDILSLCGSFEPKAVRPGVYQDDWIRDPFVLMGQLKAGARAIERIGSGTYLQQKQRV